jgi:hypothetical protein
VAVKKPEIDGTLKVQSPTQSLIENATKRDTVRHLVQLHNEAHVEIELETLGPVLLQVILFVSSY